MPTEFYKIMTTLHRAERSLTRGECEALGYKFEHDAVLKRWSAWRGSSTVTQGSSLKECLSTLTDWVRGWRTLSALTKIAKWDQRHEFDREDAAILGYHLLYAGDTWRAGFNVRGKLRPTNTCVTYGHRDVSCCVDSIRYDVRKRFCDELDTIDPNREKFSWDLDVTESQKRASQHRDAASASDTIEEAAVQDAVPAKPTAEWPDSLSPAGQKAWRAAERWWQAGIQDERVGEQAQEDDSVDVSGVARESSESEDAFVAALKELDDLTRKRPVDLLDERGALTEEALIATFPHGEGVVFDKGDLNSPEEIALRVMCEEPCSWGRDDVLAAIRAGVELHRLEQGEKHER
jgi:hypothetical protein